jgi:hypothetical protein
LERPSTLVALCILAAFSALIVPIWYLKSVAQLHEAVAVFAGIVGCVAAGWLGVTVTRPFKTLIPSHYSRVKELVQYMIAQNPRIVKGDEKGWTREQAWCTVRNIIIEQLGVHDFTEDSQFGKDLRVD